MQTTVRIGGVIVALALFAGNNRLRRATASSGEPAPGSARPALGRTYWIVVAIEVAALLGGLAVINAAIGVHSVNVPWIAFVVGVHFFGLAPLWNARVFYAVLGVVVAMLGVAGFALHAAGASEVTVQVVSGIGSGVALFLAVAQRLARGLADRPGVSRERVPSDV
jgi:hypothetical protein